MITEKQKIVEYIQNVKGRKVYISELAEELRIDFDVIEKIMTQLKEEEQPEKPKGLYRIRTNITLRSK